jgi:hypothetical protein
MKDIDRTPQDIMQYMGQITNLAVKAYEAAEDKITYSVEDLIQEAAVVFYEKVIPTYDPSKRISSLHI